jgi:hypothetical protein
MGHPCTREDLSYVSFEWCSRAELLTSAANSAPSWFDHDLTITTWRALDVFQAKILFAMNT